MVIKVIPARRVASQYHDLMRAYAAAQRLVALLEVAGMEPEARVARRIRHDIWDRMS